MMEAITSFDAGALMWIQENLRTPVLDGFFWFMSLIGAWGAVWILAGLVCVCFKKTRGAGFFLWASLAVEYLINDVALKPLIARIRPYEVVEGLTLLVSPEGSFSFPSGHTAAGFAAALAITLAFGKKGAWAYVLAGLIAISRLYVGVHYPTDVLAGMIVGSLATLIVYIVVRFAMKKKFPLVARG